MKAQLMTFAESILATPATDHVSYFDTTLTEVD